MPTPSCVFTVCCTNRERMWPSCVKPLVCSSCCRSSPTNYGRWNVTHIHIPRLRLVVRSDRDQLSLTLPSGLSSDLEHSVLKVLNSLKLAREDAERNCGPLSKRSFLLTDKGSSFIAGQFVDFVDDKYSYVRIQYRTPQQLGLLKWLHRTLLTEEVHWTLYNNRQHARECLAEFQVRYNSSRPHWALLPECAVDPLVPADVYSGGEVLQVLHWQGWARVAREKLKELLPVA